MTQVKFFKDFGYFKAGESYELEDAAADYMLRKSFSCYNNEPLEARIITNPATFQALGKEI